ncbi:MAG: methionyl-tRNA formyltransferase [Microcoleaceae cyanobacterium]
MKIVFFGTPQFAVPTLTALLQHPEVEVLGVVTQPDKRRGRGNKLIPSPVKSIAVEQNLPIWQPSRVKKDQPTLALLRQAEADAFVVVAYGQILSPEILAMPKLGCINGHGSILPQYRGAAPIQWCLYHGESKTGMTTMLMDAGMDTGPMLLKQTLPISILETSTQLGQRLADLGATLMLKTLFQLQQHQISPIPQDDTQATYAPLIKPLDYQLNWSNSAIDLHNQIRGFYPNCVTQFREQVLKVSQTVPLTAQSLEQLSDDFQSLKQQQQLLQLSSLSGKPGEVVSIIKRWGPVIQTGEGLLLLKEVKLAGKRLQSGWDFANGTRIAIGEVLS